MSTNQLLYSATATDNESWKSLGLNSLHVQNLTVNGHPLTYDKLDATVQVNTYDGSNNLVTADVFSVNIHAILVGHIVVLTVAAMGYTAPGAFNYFGFQLPSDFFPDTLNSSLYLVSVNATFGASKYAITNTGQVRIFKDANATNFALNDVFASPQQTITYDNSN